MLLARDLDRLGAAVGDEHAVAGAAQHRCDVAAHHVLVLDEQDRLRAARRRLRRGLLRSRPAASTAASIAGR